MYDTAEGKYEVYQLFFEKALKTSNKTTGVVSLITPQTWFSIIQALKLRKYILNNFSIEKIIFLGKDIFDASVDTSITFINLSDKTSKIQYWIAGNSHIITQNTTIKELSVDKIKVLDYVIPILEVV